MHGEKGEPGGPGVAQGRTTSKAPQGKKQVNYKTFADLKQPKKKRTPRRYKRRGKKKVPATTQICKARGPSTPALMRQKNRKEKEKIARELGGGCHLAGGRKEKMKYPVQKEVKS